MNKVIGTWVPDTGTELLAGEKGIFKRILLPWVVVADINPHREVP
jgi:hypothetical protein